jgi:hypothetical protein
MKTGQVEGWTSIPIFVLNKLGLLGLSACRPTLGHQKMVRKLGQEIPLNMQFLPDDMIIKVREIGVKGEIVLRGNFVKKIENNSIPNYYSDVI